MKLLDNNTVLITGGARGIGKGVCDVFTSQGANVAFTYLNSESTALSLEKEWRKRGVKVKAYKSDATNFEQAQTLAKQVIDDFGNIDCLINNAGITKDNLLMRIPESDFDAVINANLKSVFNMVKGVQPYMLKKRNGTIINISSVVGIRGNAGQSNYAASKAGIIGFSKSIAQELGSRNIRCNVVAPGFIETEMTQKLSPSVVESWIKSIPLKRTGTPEDIGRVCLFLASDWASYISGEVITVNGGMP